MKTQQRIPASAFRSEHYYDWALYPGLLKPELGRLKAPQQQKSPDYPSPPMSSPPSPTRSYPELSATTSVESSNIQSFPTSQGSPSSTAAAQLPSLSSQSLPQPATSISQFVPLGPQSTSAGLLQPGRSVPLLPPPNLDDTRQSDSSNTRTGRKSKAHVASACVNCKRAHLSCDVQRPCSRCIATGKQDTCVDVQHKKRGRPRLREEGEFKIERVMPQQTTPSVGPSTSSAPTARPIASTRHRRTESLRSLRSQTSDSSSGAGAMTSGYPTPAALQPSFSWPGPRPRNTGLSAIEVPTAYLDLDFVFIKANRPFQQIISRGNSVTGTRLEQLVVPADSDSFPVIRDRLRAERHTREPLYMPPIQQGGLDPLQGVSEVDIDRLTHSFDDRTYTWARNQSGGSSETFPARVRLAKASTYFVVVTLPSFRPVEPDVLRNPPPFPRAQGATTLSPAATLTGSSPGQLMSYSAPPYPYQHTHFTGPTLQQLHYPQPQPMAPRPYPPPLPPPAVPMFQHQQSYPPYSSPPPPPPPTAVSASRLPVVEPPMGTRPFSPRAGPSSQRQSETALQLAPIRTTSPPTVAGAAPETTQTTMTAPGTRSSSDGDSEESPRKRRRMGISDVLQG